MRCVVTGAAGFIGSHLCERLLHLGHEVVGLDAFVPYYPREFKENNLKGLRRHPRFRMHAVDLRRDEFDDCIQGAEVIIHLAAMPGLVQSWSDFDSYMTCNIMATQKLLEAVHRMGPGLWRFILGSTSSVYGKYASGDETLPTRPISPYGVTKLAAEHLCRAAMEMDDLPLVILRFFSVYGPRQRPDMAYHRFIDAMQRGMEINVCGDGMQVRGNTFVMDCVDAIIAAFMGHVGEVYNIGGGETATIWDIIARLEHIAGRKAKIQHVAERPGDQRYTFADTTKLQRHVGWQPKTKLEEGLTLQWRWQLDLRTLPFGLRDAA